jgi:PAS domain S-box-containing protein
MEFTNNTARIVIVDDDEDDFLITSEFIRSIPDAKFDILWNKNFREGVSSLLSGEYHLFFVDYRLGAKSGIDFLQEASLNKREEPIILLTGKGNYEVDIQAMQLGAVDYLVKTDLSVEKMERSIRYALERAATLKALRANERKFRSIFENSKDVIFITDYDLCFKDINGAVEGLLGFTVEEARSQCLGDLIEQAQHKKFLQQSVQLGNEVNDWEVVLTTKTGEKKTCVMTITYEESPSDGPYIQGIVHDITNLKKMEKTTLQSEKLAAAGRLVRTIAHEVRNPLNNITLSVEQIQEYRKSSADDNLHLYIDIIQRNSKRINDLISELLNTSRPADNLLHKETLQNILDDVIAASIDRLTLKRIKLHVSYPQEPQFILADKEKLKLALLNVVINAIEAMEEQKGKLDIILQTKSDSGAVLKISDNGCGISEESISRLFEPYFTQKRNGVGLGLTFTLNILQAHKAGIEVTSAPATGTTFTITFPAVNESVGVPVY